MKDHATEFAAFSARYKILIVRSSRDRSPSRSELWLAGITALALALRVIGLSWHSLLFDEAFTAVSARDIAFNGTPMWDATSNAHYAWFMAQLFQLFGSDSEWIVRLPIALAGTLLVPLTYYLARNFTSSQVSLSAAAILALNPSAIAMSRVALIDPAQATAILALLLLYEAGRERGISWFAVSAIILGSGLAFVLKYNAIWVLLLWLAIGVVLRRYELALAAKLALCSLCGALLMLALWPYDLTIWFVVLLAKGGAYDISEAFSYFYRHIQVVSFSLFIPAIVLPLVLPQRKRALHILLFAASYFVMIVVLGRAFQRYLVLLAPMISILLAMSAAGLIAQFERQFSRRNIAIGIVLLLLTALGAHSYTRSALAYCFYLSNDVPMRQVVTRATAIGGESSTIFWNAPEPVMAYYLGYSQLYSRSVRGVVHPSRRNVYFDRSSIAYTADTLPYATLVARRAIREWGIARSFLHPLDFLREVEQRTAFLRLEKEHRQWVSYDTASLVQAGDLLVHFSGVRDLIGEPVLVPFEPSNFPPIPSQLSASGFEVMARFGNPSDDSLRQDPRLAGAWILRKQLSVKLPASRTPDQ